MKQAVIWHYAPKPELRLNKWLGRCARANCGPRSTCHLPVTADMWQERRQGWCGSRPLALTPSLALACPAGRCQRGAGPLLGLAGTSVVPLPQHGAIRAGPGGKCQPPARCSLWLTLTGVNQGLPCCRQRNSS